MSTAGGDCGCGAAAAEVEWVAWCAGVFGVAVAKLTTKIGSPALHCAVVKYGASVRLAGGDSGCGAACPEVDGCAWCAGLGSCSVTKLSSVVISPTLSAAVGQQSTSVISPTADLNRVVRLSGSDRRTKNPLRSWWNLCATNCSY